MEIEKISKILIAGEGGQGVQAIAKILLCVLTQKGYKTTYIPQFGPEQRGTPSIAFIKFSKSEIGYPKFKSADLMLVFCRRAYEHSKKFINNSTIIVFDSSTIPRKIINQKNEKLFGIPATKIANEEFSVNFSNIISLSAICNLLLKIDKSIVWSCIKKQFELKFAKDSKLENLNQKLLEKGYDIKFENLRYSKADYNTSDQVILKSGSGKKACILPKFCKGCGICIEKCPVAALKFGKTLGVYGTPTPEVDLEKCIGCGTCSKFCPDSAIKIEKK